MYKLKISYFFLIRKKLGLHRKYKKNVTRFSGTFFWETTYDRKLQVRKSTLCKNELDDEAFQRYRKRCRRHLRSSGRKSAVGDKKKCHSRSF